jgi:hypothetical protein
MLLLFSGILVPLIGSTNGFDNFQFDYVTTVVGGDAWKSKLSPL